MNTMQPLRHLASIVDLPYFTPSGRFVARPGYDPETCLFLEMPLDWRLRVPERPDAAEVRSALKVMVEPFHAYQFANPASAGGLLSAIFATVSRPVMDICPAWLFEAACQASGKTKAATAIGGLMEGRRVGVTPFAGTSTDDEMRKRMVAGAVDGVRFHCIDNVTGFYRSSALAAVLTSGRLNDRILGQSRTVDASIRSLITLTGNNAALDADLQRRVVVVRLDGGNEPGRRVFEFDPVAVALARRRQIVEAVCVVLQTYFVAGAPDVVAGDAGGFADWNRLCRQPVLWLAREGFADALPWPEVGDPAESMLADPSGSDPEIEATGDLLIALHALSGGKVFTAAEAVAWHVMGERFPDEPSGALRSAVIECTGRQEINSRSFGRVMLNRRDRVIGGLKLIASGGGRMKSWRVVAVE